MRVRPNGFTLIELMVAVAIIGILSSIAIPEFRAIQLRSRQTERTVLMTSIQRAMDDYFHRESRYPRDWGMGTSGLWGADNPNFAPSTYKRKWRLVDWGDDWKLLSLAVEGDVYYSYWMQAVAQPGNRQVWIGANGDLDGNTVQDQIQRLYFYTGTRLERFWGAQSCSDCSMEWRWPSAEGREY